MEPWDGPAAVAFTDGTLVGRDARPQRPAARPLGGDRATAASCWPPRRACCDTRRRRSCARAACSRASCSWSTSTSGRIVDDEEIKRELAAQKPYGEWSSAAACTSTTCRQREPASAAQPSRCATRQLAFGYTQEDLRVLLAPMAATGRSRPARWATTSPLAVLSDRAAALFYVLQAAVRPGHQPADRPDPRDDRDEPATRLGPERTCSRRRPSTPTSS